jgi:K+-sensing histidine kinase KdpD
VDDAVLASRLGAKILWLDSPDMVGSLLRLANQFHIGRVFVPRQRPTPLSWLFGRTLYSGLLSRAEGTRIDVVGLGRGK